MRRTDDNDGFLLVTPGSCRHHAGDSAPSGHPAAHPDNARFRRWYAREFGYTPPRPLHLAATLDAARKVDFADLDENNQILAACHQAVAPHLQDLRKRMVLRAEDPDLLFELIDFRFKVINSPSLPPADAAARDYWLGWRRLGDYRDEQRLEVGLVSCCLTLFTLDRQLHLTFWERETHVAQRADIEEAFRRQCVLLSSGLASRHVPTLVAEVVRDWFGATVSMVPAILQQAADHTVHLYQDPAWEHFWNEVGKENLSAEIRRRNHHPGSGRWTRQDGRFVVPGR